MYAQKKRWFIYGHSTATPASVGVKLLVFTLILWEKKKNMLPWHLCALQLELDTLTFLLIFNQKQSTTKAMSVFWWSGKWASEAMLASRAHLWRFRFFEATDGNTWSTEKQLSQRIKMDCCNFLLNGLFRLMYSRVPNCCFFFPCSCKTGHGLLFIDTQNTDSQWE